MQQKIDTSLKDLVAACDQLLGMISYRDSEDPMRHMRP